MASDGIARNARTDRAPANVDKSPRPKSRWRARITRVVAVLTGIACVVLVAPTFVGRTRLSERWLTRVAAERGIPLEVQSLRIGWFSQLRMSGVRIRDPQGAIRYSVARIESDQTLFDLLGLRRCPSPSWVLRSVRLACPVKDGRFGIRDDIEPLFQGDDSSPGMLRAGSIQIQDLVFRAVNDQSGEQWKLSRATVDVTIGDDAIESSFAGVVSQRDDEASSRTTAENPSGSRRRAADTPLATGGRLRGDLRIALPSHAADNDNPRHEKLPWDLKIQGDSFPLSIVTLIRTTVSDDEDNVANSSAWEQTENGLSATGIVEVGAGDDGFVRVSTDHVRIETHEPLKFEHLQLRPHESATISGELVFEQNRIRAQGLQADLGYATVQFDGSVELPPESSADEFALWNPLNRVDATASVAIDLAKMEAALPGVLRLDERSKIRSGTARLDLKKTSTVACRGRSVALRTSLVVAEIEGRPLEIPPIEIQAGFQQDEDVEILRELRCDSSFAQIVGTGEPRHGRITVDVDLDELDSMLQVFDRWADTELRGQVRGETTWKLSQETRWALAGSLEASDLRIAHNGQSINEPRLTSTLRARGNWKAQTLEELIDASLLVSGNSLDLEAKLASPVSQPALGTPLPVQLRGQGDIQSVATLLASWLPEESHEAEGEFALNVHGELSPFSTRVTRANVQLSKPKIAVGSRWYRQEAVNAHFDGSWSITDGGFQANDLRFESDFLSLEVYGGAHSQRVDLSIDWTADLSQLRTGVHAVKQTVKSQRTSRADADEAIADDHGDWPMRGRLAGKARAQSRTGGSIEVEASARCRDLKVMRTSGPAEDDRWDRERDQADTLASSEVIFPRDAAIWTDPDLQCATSLRYDPQTGLAEVRFARVSSDWASAELAGTADWTSNQTQLNLKGSTAIDMVGFGRHLSELLGVRFQLEGKREAPLEIRVESPSDGELRASLASELSWDGGEVAGLEIGAASIPIFATESHFQIPRTTVPVGNGQVHLDGDVQYGEGVVSIRLNPGLVAEKIELTHELTDRWFHFIAPPTAKVKSVGGRFDTELDEAFIVVGRPRQSRVSGRLRIERADLEPSRLMKAVLRATRDIRSVAEAQGLPPAGEKVADIVMPAQTVEFDLKSAIVNHKRILFEVQHEPVVFSGQVTLDGRLNMIATVPRNFMGTAKAPNERPLHIPVTGTVYNPRVDLTGLGNLMAIMTSKAVMEPRGGRKEGARRRSRKKDPPADEARNSIESSKAFFESTAKLMKQVRAAMETNEKRRRSKSSEREIR